MNAPNKIPDSITRIPVTAMKLPELRRLQKATWRFLNELDEIKKTVPELAAQREDVRQLWSRALDELRRRDLVAAQREKVLWTVFQKRSYGLVEIIRTQHFRIQHWWNKEYRFLEEPFTMRSTGTAERAHTWEEPWKEFAKAQVAA